MTPPVATTVLALLFVGHIRWVFSYYAATVTGSVSPNVHFSVTSGYLGSKEGPTAVLQQDGQVSLATLPCTAPSVTLDEYGGLVNATLALCESVPFVDCAAVTCAASAPGTATDCWTFRATANVSLDARVSDDPPDDDDIVWTTFLRRIPLRCHPVSCESLPWSDRLVRRCARDRLAPPSRRSLWPINVPADHPHRAPWLVQLLADIRRRDRTPRRACSDVQVGQLSVLTGCADAWPGRHAWSSVDRIFQRHRNDSLWRAEVQGLAGYEDRTLASLRDARAAGLPYYVFDTMSSHPSELSLYQTPPAFAAADLYSWPDNVPYSYGPVRWLAFGSTTGTGTVMHLDPLGIDAWNTLFAGYKYWFIFPPNVTQALGPYLSCSAGLATVPLSPWTATGGTPFVLGGAIRDLLQDPSLPTPIEVLQAPGETIYVPRGYLHGVFNFGETVAVTEGHAMAHNGPAVWHEHVLPNLCQSRAFRHLYRLYYSGRMNAATRHLARTSRCDEDGPTVVQLSQRAVR